MLPQGMDKTREMEVINFVYRLSQTVKCLNEGRTVYEGELERIKQERPAMRLAAHDLREVYPELPNICDRMCARLQMLLADGQAVAGN